MTLLDDLCADLQAEGDELADVLADLGETGWETMTAAEPWRVKDQISHLAWNDDATVRALTQPVEFLAAKPEGPQAIQAMVDQVIVDYQHLPGTEMLSWFRGARGSLIQAFAGRDPKERMPWYGPEMSLASKLTARFMETWAHGYDVFDALGTDQTSNRSSSSCRLPWVTGSTQRLHRTGTRATRPAGASRSHVAVGRTVAHGTLRYRRRCPWFGVRFGVGRDPAIEPWRC